MVGVNSGDGRGNITAYATVFDSDQCCNATATTRPVRCDGAPRAWAARSRVPGSFSDFGANDNSNAGPGLIEGTSDDVDTNPLPSYNFTVDRARATSARSTTRSGPVQLRPAESLPAS